LSSELRNNVIKVDSNGTKKTSISSNEGEGDSVKYIFNPVLKRINEKDKEKKTLFSRNTHKKYWRQTNNKNNSDIKNL